MSDVTWDSNGTHAIATTAGHKTDGFAANEVPTSDEMNGWMKAVGARLDNARNKSARGCTVYSDVSGAAFSGNTAVATQIDAGGFVVGDGTNKVEVWNYLNVGVGESIAEIHYRRFGDGVHGFDLGLVRDNGDGTQTVVQSATETPAAAWGTGTLTLGTPEVAVVGKSYAVVAVIFAGGSTEKVASVGYTVA